MALNRPGVVTVFQGVGLSLSVPMMLWLIPRYGIYGAAVLAARINMRAPDFCLCTDFRVFLKTAPPRLLPAWSDIEMLLGACSLLLRERAA